MWGSKKGFNAFSVNLRLKQRNNFYVPHIFFLLFFLILFYHLSSILYSISILFYFYLCFYFYFLFSFSKFERCAIIDVYMHCPFMPQLSPFVPAQHSTALLCSVYLYLFSYRRMYVCMYIPNAIGLKDNFNYICYYSIVVVVVFFI